MDLMSVRYKVTKSSIVDLFGIRRLLCGMRNYLYLLYLVVWKTDNLEMFYGFDVEVKY